MDTMTTVDRGVVGVAVTVGVFIGPETVIVVTAPLFPPLLGLTGGGESA